MTVFRKYLEHLNETLQYLRIVGIGSGAGRVRTASQYPIERLYTPLRSRGDGMDFDFNEPDLLDSDEGSRNQLSRVLPRCERLLIEGDPGAGKTTFLNLVACMLAKDLLAQESSEYAHEQGVSWRSRYLGLAEDSKLRTPVLLSCGELDLFLREKERERYENDPRRSILDFLEDKYSEAKFAVTRADFETLLEDDRAWLLIDSLDEVGDRSMREYLFAVLQGAMNQWAAPMVIASRPFLTDLLLTWEGLNRTTIENFGDHETRVFIRQWVHALFDIALEDSLSQASESYREELLHAIESRPAIRQLAVNPVMLTSLCVIHWNERRIPDGRTAVYRAVIRWLLESRSKERAKLGLTDAFALQGFARLSLALMEGVEGEGKQSVISFEEAGALLEKQIARYVEEDNINARYSKIREWLSFESQGSGILRQIGSERLRFWHLTFQEYLAAQELSSYIDDEEDRGARKAWWPIIKEVLDKPQWHETMSLFPCCLFGEDQNGRERVDEFLERVVRTYGNRGLAEEARTYGILERMLTPLSVFGYRPEPSIREAYHQARAKAMRIFDPKVSTAFVYRERIAIAEVLGRSGDPRVGHMRKNFLPIAEGSDVLLGKYLVTVKEFQEFIEHLGYEPEGDEFWGDEGLEWKDKKGWKMPRRWKDQENHPNRPVVGVSWFEAVAYCNWRSRMTGYVVRLPAESEWELAASPDGREFPWGANAPSPELTNFADKVGGPSPVGVNPNGAGYLGHLDLAGNVWEWSAQDHEVELPAEFVTEFGAPKVLRGGSFADGSWGMRCACRSSRSVGRRHGHLGFRAVFIPSVPYRPT